MTLKELTENVETDKIIGDAEILGVSCSSKHKGSRWLFVCNEKDERKLNLYAAEALRNGAAAVAAAREITVSVPLVVAKDIRRFYAFACAAFYGDPQSSLKIIGVVGTNGKTTVTRIVSEVFTACGIKCGVIGTLGAFFNGKDYETELTTPDPEDLFSLLKKMKDDGAEAVAIEYSAHAIFYEKLSPVFFECLVFTNCTQDHLDFFKDMKIYSSVKESVFKSGNARYLVVNSDDELGAKIISESDSNVIAYGVKNPSDVFALKIKIKPHGTTFFVNAFDGIEKISVKLLGLFNVYNVLAVIGAAHAFSLPLSKAALALSKVEPISGRLERVAQYKGGDVFVDYAHTPDGLENALITLCKVTENRLIVVFGCGGNRDKSKRAAMGRVAGDIADLVVVTNDNPRFEDPDAIINDIERGLREATLDYILIKDREHAIRYAMNFMTKGDVLLIAGKGAEEYQEVMGVKHEFSDKKVVLAIAAERKSNT